MFTIINYRPTSGTYGPFPTVKDAENWAWCNHHEAGCNWIVVAYPAIRTDPRGYIK